MSETQTFDIAIVGSGIAGASLAYHLAGQRSVILLEREEQHGYHSTGRSAALFMEYYGTPQIQALTRASRAFYTTPPQDFSEHTLLEARGCLYIGTHEQQHLLQSAYDDSKANANHLELVDADTALKIVPVLRPSILVGALYEEGASDIDVHALHHGFLKGMRQLGGQQQCSAEVVAVHREQKVWHLRLANGATVRAKQIVDAAGAWADELAKMCGVQPVGLQPCRRTAFTFPGPEGLAFNQWPAVIGIDESFYFKPDAGQLLGSPANADPVPAHDVMPEEIDVATGIYHIEEMTTLKIRRPSHTWAGLRSFVPDGDLVIGWDNHCPDFFWLAAQGGYGIQSAAGVAELAASLVLGKTLPAGLEAEGVKPELSSPARIR